MLNQRRFLMKTYEQSYEQTFLYDLRTRGSIYNSPFHNKNLKVIYPISD